MIRNGVWATTSQRLWVGHCCDPPPPTCLRNRWVFFGPTFLPPLPCFLGPIGWPGGCPTPAGCGCTTRTGGGRTGGRTSSTGSRRSAHFTTAAALHASAICAARFFTTPESPGDAMCSLGQPYLPTFSNPFLKFPEFQEFPYSASH